MKNNKGITLIALVVTIIILLILAGVSITTLSGNGLFGRAQSGAAKYQEASEEENRTISSILDIKCILSDIPHAPSASACPLAPI